MLKNSLILLVTVFLSLKKKKKKLFPVAELIKIGKRKLFNEVTGLGFFTLVILKALLCEKFF